MLCPAFQDLSRALRVSQGWVGCGLGWAGPTPRNRFANTLAGCLSSKSRRLLLFAKAAATMSGRTANGGWPGPRPPGSCANDSALVRCSRPASRVAAGPRARGPSRAIDGRRRRVAGRAAAPISASSPEATFRDARTGLPLSIDGRCRPPARRPGVRFAAGFARARAIKRPVADPVWVLPCRANGVGVGSCCGGCALGLDGRPASWDGAVLCVGVAAATRGGVARRSSPAADGSKLGGVVRAFRMGGGMVNRTAGEGAAF
ncbi:hypothetical protein A3768_4801 (plasmid) [Ralstonia solanacearum]|nr:hypothetical protein F504_4732 [Ralstonia pseudosolanacearum FQY_4]ANH35604.1 hypothetical protein A3768_4801 [Ralstonia solanacearum]